MAATTAPSVGGPSHLAPTAAPEDLTSVKLQLSLRRLGVGRKEVSPDEPFLESLSEDDSHESASPRSSPPSWTSSPCSHQSHPPSSQFADLDEVIPFSLSKFRQRSNRAEAERRNRQWLSGTLALLGGMMAMVLAAYQLRFALPVLRKAAVSSVPAAAAGSSRSYHSTSSSPPGTGAAAPGIAGNIQESVASKLALRRQWMFGIFAIAFSIFSAKFVARLHAWTLGVRRWMQPNTVQRRLPLHSKVEEEFAELYSIKDESVGTNDDFAWGSDPLVMTAIRKCLDDYRTLNRQTHQSAFAIFFHLAAESRKRQIAYSMYRNACDALHAKVEQNRPVLSDEVAEVLNRQRALRQQYNRMQDDINFTLSEENLPPGLCQEELEFLTKDFRPSLLELAKHTIYSLDMDRRFIEAFIKLHNIHYVWQEEDGPADGSPNNIAEETDLQEQPQQRQDQRVSEENKSVPEDMTSENSSELAMHESQFWDARRTLSSYRRGTFTPKVPGFDRCSLPELPLSLFAY
ncbi:uncharacterized protein EMH_0017200 [Eimeria mitis]|uniref:Uncharacterized protein n=1 Tax=Eimeria mitis TaxID=44415 RepID=U6KE18_9EIME|nr:uncharacterized protein EMH_0017200 [Eimeria mitis]CDJ33723.1 hypothetical protein, conserved [Eimeria mitis]